MAASYTLAQCALSLLEGLHGRLPLAHANWLRVAGTGGSCRHMGLSCSAAAAQRPEGQEDRTKIRALIYEAVYHPDPLLGVAEHRGDVQQQRGAQATAEDMDHDRLHVWGLRTTGARCGLMLCCGMVICVCGERCVLFGRYSLYMWPHLVEGPSRSRGRVPPSEASSVEAARSVGGEHVLLHVTIGEAVLEGAGLRGRALGQSLLADVSVSEMVQGVPLNAVH